MTSPTPYDDHGPTESSGPLGGLVISVKQTRKFARVPLRSFGWKGGGFAHQRPHSIMDNADNTAVGAHLAFILLSVGCSVLVAGSDIGPKVLDIMLGH
jgi:hypothetical protein